MEYKLAYMVIVCCLLVYMSLIGTNMALFHTAKKYGALTYLLSQIVAYLLYPLLGWLADVYFTRYKFILFSFITMIVTTVGMVTGATLFMIYTCATPLYVIAGVGLIIGLLGLGLFSLLLFSLDVGGPFEGTCHIHPVVLLEWYDWTTCNIMHEYWSIGVL